MNHHPQSPQDWLDLIHEVNNGRPLDDDLVELLSSIEDQEILYQLVLRVSNMEILPLLIPALESEHIVSLLKERNNPEIRFLLAQHLTSPQLAYEMYYKEKDETIRLAILDQMMAAKEHTVVALLDGEKSPTIKAKLIGNLHAESHGEVLERIVFGDEFVEPRRMAAGKITNQEVLLTILEKEQNGEVRAAVIPQLDDIVILKTLAVDDLYWKVRIAALKKLDDTAILLQAAESDPAMEIRQYAVERIDDPNLLASIAMNETNHALRKRAVELIIEQEDSDTLKVIALEEDDPVIKILAIDNIDNQEILARIINNSQHTGVREVAIQRLFDIDILIMLFRELTDLKLQKAIISRLIELEEYITLELLQSESMGSIRRMISSYLEDI